MAGPHPAWWSFLGGMALYFFAGSSVVIGDFTRQLRQSTGLDQSTLTLTISCGFVGYLAVFGGLAVGHWGARAAVLCSAAMMSGGYLLVYLATLGVVPRTPFAITMFYGLAIQGQYWQLVSGAALLAASFPRQAGLAGGIVECSFGAAPALWAVLKDGFVPDEAGTPGVPVFGFMAAVVAATTMALAPCGLREDRPYLAEMRSFAGFYAMQGIWVVILSLLLVSQVVPSLGARRLAACTVALLTAFLAAPLIGARSEARGGACKEALLPTGEHAEERGPSSFQELRPREACGNGVFWSLLLSICLPLGVCYSLTQNIGAVVAHVQADGVGELTSSVEIVASVASGVAALVGGSASDALVRRVPRPWWLAAGSASVACGNVVLLARPDIVGVYVGFTLCLFGFALLWATFMACVNELLGSSSYPIFFGFFNFVYSVLQLGLNTCVWVPAFQASGEYSHAFMVYACVCFASALVALMLGWTVRGFYSAMPE